MSALAETLDSRVRANLADKTSSARRYWNFENVLGRSHSHDYYQYPAMMVPDMLAGLIQAVVAADSKVKCVLDPFVGSGTVQTEAMSLGLDFSGLDINPLAILLCRAKAGPFLPAKLEDAAEDLISMIEEDTSCKREAEFDGLTKWFDAAVTIGLSRIRRAIRTESSLQIRRFFWVALAETVRLSSHSRTSTYKLHVRSQAERALRRIDPASTFEQIVWRNIESLRELTSKLGSEGLLSRGQYSGSVSTKLKSATSLRQARKYDLLVTSPPYGDNSTTVPYGQSSFLPLQWIDLSDIDEKATQEFLCTTHQIDSMSLGGSKRSALENVSVLSQKSLAFARFYRSLIDQPQDRRVRVAAFIRDLDACLDPILQSLKRDAYMIWVVGNRRVGGQRVPLDSIVGELLCARGAVEISTIRRSIPSGAKRMAVKNNLSHTMTKESILIYRNACKLP
jgi:hypothetical protein